MANLCFCGSLADFTQCCSPIISGEIKAETAEQLMRARYSAYVEGDVDFLHDSLHPQSRENFDFEATQTWAETSEWTGLTILDVKAGLQSDKVGSVDFTAIYINKDGKEHQHSERSQFKRYKDEWYFCDGQSIVPQKVGRNDPCICGSGKKSKKCCGA